VRRKYNSMTGNNNSSGGDGADSSLSASGGSGGAGGTGSSSQELEFLETMARQTENQLCADCNAPNPTWLSITLGTWICADCASLHKEILSKDLVGLRSLEQCLQQQQSQPGNNNNNNNWPLDLIQFMKAMGNKVANELWEARFARREIKPTIFSEKGVKSAWLRLKYEAMEFVETSKSGHVMMKRLFSKNNKTKKMTTTTTQKYKRSYISTTPSNIEIYKEKGDKQAYEVIPILAHNIKEAPRTEKEFANCFQLISPKMSYLVNVATPEEVIHWSFYLKIASRRLLLPIDEKVRQAAIKLLQANSLSSSTTASSLPSVSLPLTASGGGGSSGSGGGGGEGGETERALSGTDSRVLKELIISRSEDRKKEMTSLNERLLSIDETLQQQTVEITRLRDQLKELESKHTSLKEEQQAARRKLNTLQLPELNSSVKAPQDEGADNAPNTIILNEDGSVKGGTVQKLVEMLTHEQYVDPDYLSMFLLTYRSFTTSGDLMAKLEQRHQIAPPPFASDEELKRFRDTVQKPIHLRITNVIKNWVTSYYYDFAGDPTLLETLVDFIDQHMDSKVVSEQLKKNIHKKVRKRKVVFFLFLISFLFFSWWQRPSHRK
jgi:hypothetical protein